MFVDYFSVFTPWCDSVIVDDGCLSTVGNNGCEFSVSENIILSETGDESATEFSAVSMLHSGSSSDTSVTWSDCVASMDNDGSIECERMSSEVDTTEGSVCVSESKILVELENSKACQPSVEA